MKPRALLPLLFALAGAPACGSEDAVPFDDGRGSPEEGLARQPYPEAPYGTEKGAVIESFRFLGWSDPAAADHDEAQLRTLSLADFYDPDGTKGVRYVVLTSTAVWCGVCRFEYEDFASGRVAEYEKEGVAFFGALFEDNDSMPARPADLTLWAQSFDVRFPFVLDPGFKLGAFFDRTATPMTMVIDARTMRIIWLEVGWAAEGPASIWTFLDQKLGR